LLIKRNYKLRIEAMMLRLRLVIEASDSEAEASDAEARD
jgi:hypothetical protein